MKISFYTRNTVSKGEPDVVRVITAHAGDRAPLTVKGATLNVGDSPSDLKPYDLTGCKFTVERDGAIVQASTLDEFKRLIHDETSHRKHLADEAKKAAEAAAKAARATAHRDPA